MIACNDSTRTIPDAHSTDSRHPRLFYGLSAYVASTDIERANSVARRLRAGNVHINGQWGEVSMPFGGYKQSGNGREGGVYGFPDFLETKAVMGYH